jgi:hypothetical protein
LPALLLKSEILVWIVVGVGIPIAVEKRLLPFDRHSLHVVKNVCEKLVTNASRKSRLHTDESRLYDAVGQESAKHETVNHGAKEYAGGDVTTNSVEGFFGIFTRGMVGVYQHCGEQHLQRYLDEFAFHYTNRAKLGVNDDARVVIATYGMNGKRLTYRRISAA